MTGERPMCFIRWAVGCTATVVIVLAMLLAANAALGATATPADGSEVTLHMYADTTFPVSVSSSVRVATPPPPGVPNDDGEGQAAGVPVRSTEAPAPDLSPATTGAVDGDTSSPSFPVAVSPAPDPVNPSPDLGSAPLVEATFEPQAIQIPGVYIVGSSHNGCQFILFLSDGTQLVNDDACLPDTPDNGEGGSVPLPGGNADIDIDHSKTRRVQSDPGINGARPPTPPTLVPPPPPPVRGCTETARPDTYTISYPDRLVLHCDQVSS